MTVYHNQMVKCNLRAALCGESKRGSMPHLVKWWERHETVVNQNWGAPAQW